MRRDCDDLPAAGTSPPGSLEDLPLSELSRSATSDLAARKELDAAARAYLVAGTNAFFRALRSLELASHRGFVELFVSMMGTSIEPRAVRRVQQKVAADWRLHERLERVVAPEDYFLLLFRSTFDDAVGELSEADLVYLVLVATAASGAASHFLSGDKYWTFLSSFVRAAIQEFTPRRVLRIRDVLAAREPPRPS